MPGRLTASSNRRPWWCSRVEDPAVGPALCAGRSWREAARRRRADLSGFFALVAGRASGTDGPARRPKDPGVLPGGVSRRPPKAVRPG
jgi:hypothetical protein